jgi:ADP-ribose pyrophosphatase
MDRPVLTPWKTLTRRTVLDAGKFLKVEYHAVELPNGRVIEDWPWLITPDYVNIVAETSEGGFLCFRQTKYAVQGTSLAVAGGYIEPCEAPLVAAQRELREETGYEAAEWIDMGAYPVDANRGMGTGHFFLARGARRVADPASDDLEEQELLIMARGDVQAALLAGEFKAMPWVAVVALALLQDSA